MDFLLWFAIFGESVQAEARAQGCADYEMDDYLERAYLRFILKQHGELSFEDKVRYGNLEVNC